MIYWANQCPETFHFAWKQDTKSQGEGDKAVPQRLGPAGSSLEAGFLWRNTALLSLSDHWDSAAGPCPEHPKPGTHSRHTVITQSVQYHSWIDEETQSHASWSGDTEQALRRRLFHLMLPWTTRESSGGAGEREGRSGAQEVDNAWKEKMYELISSRTKIMIWPLVEILLLVCQYQY